MNAVKIGELIKELRLKKKLSQKELAKLIGVSDKTISKWETGRGIPDSSLFIPLKECFEISLEELLSGELIEDKSNHTEKLVESTLTKVAEDNKKLKKRSYIFAVGFLVIYIASSELLNYEYRDIFLIIGIIISVAGILITFIKRKVLSTLLIIITLFVCVDIYDNKRLDENKLPLFMHKVYEDENKINYKGFNKFVSICNVYTKEQYYEQQNYDPKDYCSSSLDVNRNKIDRLIHFAKPYVGDGSITNISNRLPFANYGGVNEIDSINYGFISHIDHTTSYIKEDNKQSNFLEWNIFYQACTFFTLVDNIEYVKFIFKDKEIKITKDEFIKKYPQLEELIVEKKDILTQYNELVYPLEKDKNLLK